MSKLCADRSVRTTLAGSISARWKTSKLCADKSVRTTLGVAGICKQWSL
jgi:hypothetical protein